MPSLQDIQTAAVNTIVDEVNALIEGTNEDIQAFANAIVQDSLEAAAAGRTDILATLEDQALVLAEKNRIRIANGAQRAVVDVIRIALGVATKLVIPAIPTI